jgi:hypothetical protein
MAQLKELYRPDGTSAILSNCAHQVWYPPTEHETAEAMSRLYGMTLKANPVHSSSRGSRQHKDKEGRANLQTNNNQGASWSWHERPELLPSQVMSLPKEQVMITTLAGVQRIVFLGQRLNPIPLFDKLPPASLLRLPQPRYGERFYTRWIETAVPAAKGTPLAEEQPHVPVENPAPDNQGDDEATRPSEDSGDTGTENAGKDAI